MTQRPTSRRTANPLERALALLVGVLSLVVPLGAHASGPGGPGAVAGNPATQVPRVADGQGLRLGKNSTFHGGAALAIGFDSNVFSEEPARAPRRAAFGLPSAWLTIGNRPLRNGVLDSPAGSPANKSRKVDYHLGVLAGWRFYMAGRPTVRQAGKLNVGVNARVMFAPGRRFSVALEEDFNRLGEPTNFEAGRGFNFNRYDHSGALRFLIRPGGGRISLNVAYRNELLYFESVAIDARGRSDRIVNGAESEVKYRFRDRSAFAVRYAFHNTYYFCCGDINVGRNEDSDAHRVYGGYVGQLGRKVALDVMGGWGTGIYKKSPTDADFKGFIGYAALGVFPTAKTQVALRVGRDFHDSLWGNYFTDVGASIALSHVFRWNMRLDTGLGAYGRRYVGLPRPGMDTQEIVSYTAAPDLVRRDTLVSFNAQIEQPFGKYFVVGMRYALAADITNFVVEYSNGFTQPGRFTRNLLMGFVAVRY